MIKYIVHVHVYPDKIHVHVHPDNHNMIKYIVHVHVYPDKIHVHVHPDNHNMMNTYQINLVCLINNIKTIVIINNSL